MLAVPITMHVPCVGINRPRARSSRASSMSPARRDAHSRRQSVHAPSRSPSSWPASIGPTGATIAGMFALTAPMICAGIVLSQPPTSTTASSGSARSISSVSIARRFLRMRLDGYANDSCSEMVGNVNGSPPAIVTPRSIASINRGAVA